MKSFKTFAEEWQKPKVAQVPLNKTETRLMDKIRLSSQDISGVEWGRVGGSDGGKQRSVGERERKAAESLAKKGLVKLGDVYSSVIYKNGSPDHTVAGRLVKLPENKESDEEGPWAIATYTQKGTLKRVRDTKFHDKYSAIRYGDKYHRGSSGEKRYEVVLHPDAKKD